MVDADLQLNTEKLKKFIYDKYLNFELNDESLVQIIELSGELLCLKTIQRYREATGMSYPGVLKGRNVKNILGVRFVIGGD